MKTLICVAGLPYGERTVTFGAKLAAIGAPKITLLTVAENEAGRAAAEKLLADAAALIDQPVDAQTVRVGSPVEEIVEESHEQKYEMIVIGEHVVHGLVDLFLRPVPRQVAKKAPSSVLVVKEGSRELKHILLCTGGRQVNRSVVESGAMLARDLGAKVTMLHVSDPVPVMYAGLNTMHESLEDIIKTNTPIAQHLRWTFDLLKQYQLEVEPVLAHGVAANEIMRVAQERDVDLIVIGAQVANAGWLDELLMSTVTPQVVDHASCSVLVVRAK